MHFFFRLALCLAVHRDFFTAYQRALYGFPAISALPY